MTPLSYYHAIYFPHRFRELYFRGLFFDGCSEREVRRWRRIMRHYVRKMACLDPNRPLLLKNPAYTGRVGMLHEMWPEARFIHIFRDPLDLYLSTRRALRTIVGELALQDADLSLIDQAALEAFPRQMRRLCADAERLPPGVLTHVRFEDLERAPVDTLRRIYGALGLSGLEDATAPVEAYLRSIRSYRKSAERARPEDIAAVDRHWRPTWRRLIPALHRSANEPATGGGQGWAVENQCVSSARIGA
jgi:hypothetical protein